jgi:AraC-like DNA-binding protein
MLSATGLTVAEIADRCGFQSPFHFSRLVKKLQGCSPRETRARSWAAPSSKNT